MKQTIERRKPEGVKDYLALAVTTFGVGYLPLAPGTWGSMVGVAIYAASEFVFSVATAPNPRISHDQMFGFSPNVTAWVHVAILIPFVLFCLLGIWAASRAVELLGNSDPSQAVVDEVIGQLIVFLFVPFGIGWPLILAGFLLFRLFDIWKPYPIDSLQVLPGGIGVCADDILAGVYGGICLAVIYAISLSI